MEFLEHFGSVFSLSSVFILCAGTIGGLVLGAIPGLSPTMAVALLIPFTFHMMPQHGLMLLGATYSASVAGGAISAILLKIPGAPANIATTLDGHAMAAKGDGARALQLCFLSSFIGGVIGIIVLIFLTPYLAQWALGFGPSHMFWIAILGISIIASLGGGSVVKGLLAGCIGLWISTIGYDSIQGVERFVFADALEGGVHIVPALIGLFAVPQIIQMLQGASSTSNISAVTVQRHSIWQSAYETLSKVRSWMTGSLSGVIIGLIPGAGGQIAGLVSYDQVRRFSPRRQSFGKGEPEGVIAAETANNAMVGPSLVPLLTLSVPGSPTAAVLLGGLLIHGIFPGPDIFTTHGHVVWPFINSLLIGQLLMLIFGLALAGLAARVVRISPVILASAIFIMSVMGAYSVQNSQADVIIMLTLGVGMFFLQSYGFNSAPLALGVILGPMAESNYVQGRIIAQAGDGQFAYFMTGTLNITLISLIVMSILSSLLMEILYRRKMSYTSKVMQEALP